MADADTKVRPKIKAKAKARPVIKAKARVKAQVTPKTLVEVSQIETKLDVPAVIKIKPKPRPNPIPPPEPVSKEEPNLHEQEPEQKSKEPCKPPNTYPRWIGGEVLLISMENTLIYDPTTYELIGRVLDESNVEWIE